jgi:Tol biopolymer transport system component
MSNPVEFHRRARRPAGAFVAALVLAAAAPVAGCGHKNPAAPTVPAPTHFVVFSSDRNRPPGNYRTQLAYLDGSGTITFNFNNSATVVDRRPSITQDGNLLCFETGPGKAGSEDVILYRRKPAAVLADTAAINSAANETDPYISLDGSRVAFVRDTLGVKRIRLYSLTTHTFIPLPGLEAGGATNDWAPALDGQGARIAFVSDRNGNNDVFVYQVPTTSLLSTPLSSSPDDDIEPAMSGNGQFLAWASNRAGGAGGYDVYLLDLNTSLLVAVPGNSAGDDLSPSLSNDGVYMVFASSFARPNAVGGLDLWNQNITNGTVWQVGGENTAADDFAPVVVWP